MKSAAEYLLSFLLNASWQVALIAVAAVLADLLLRRSLARHRHFIWVMALTLSFFLPFATSLRPSPNRALPATTPQPSIDAPVFTSSAPANTESVVTSSTSAFEIGARIATGVLVVFLIFLGYRSVRLLLAWIRTRAAKKDAYPFDAAHRVHSIVSECRRVIGTGEVALLHSALLTSPATVGIFRPLINLPDALMRNASDQELTAAVGHELVHVRRRDYLTNLIYEFIFLPLSFHPAAALMRRRITQTRELRCDELVTELLLRPEVYARSLVQLAGSAMPVRRPGTVAVGIADADILEVRVMSLLNRTRMDGRNRKIWLLAAALLLALPCVAAAGFAFHLTINSAQAQKPSREEQEKKEMRGRREQEIKEKLQREAQELEERIRIETDAEVKAKLERRLEEVKELMSRRIAMAVTTDGDRFVILSGEARERNEFEL